MIDTTELLNMLPGGKKEKETEHKKTIIDNSIYNPIRDKENIEIKRELMLKEYQQNIRKSAELRIKITKGVQCGEDIQILLLAAIECISIMTGDNLFYDNNRACILK